MAHPWWASRSARRGPVGAGQRAVHDGERRLQRLAEGPGFLVALHLAQPLHGHVFQQDPASGGLGVQLARGLERLDRVAELTALPLSRGRLDERRHLACPLHPGRRLGGHPLPLRRLPAIPGVAAEGGHQQRRPAAVAARATGSGHQPRPARDERRQTIAQPLGVGVKLGVIEVAACRVTSGASGGGRSSARGNGAPCTSTGTTGTPRPSAASTSCRTKSAGSSSRRAPAALRCPPTAAR